ncbi:DUF1415 domain-containing protein [Echinimonas agarilytica]|uniref:DUF1415 domain-containing protein n=1 Tax=Echinimonas agarilytica TaxID=1215918 RepID=A0AA42B7C0_9GAMM|nr:DUF1415 domain-containing protein [Echinimonas agarilytica]MCM2679451.1 DUF1415 domain-containing protein [Echinimonas agarilytica]
MTNNLKIIIQQWLDDVVIGLNLCPFAARPQRNGQIEIVVSQARSDEALMIDLQQQMARLIETPAAQLETTILAVPHMLSDFEQYNQFLDLADMLIAQSGYEGVLQVASFHPDYQFADTHPDDAENLTNRSPVPIFHLLREQSLSDAIENYTDPDKIPERNIRRMERLSPEQKQSLFHYLLKQ